MAFYALLAFGYATHRVAEMFVGRRDPMHGDAQNVWFPLAQSVLSGVPLYVPPATDNKPPLFELLNLAIAATGHYRLVFPFVIAAVNVIVALLIYRLCRQHDQIQVGVVAGFLFLATLPIVNGHMITVRTFTMAAVLLAVLANRHVMSGAWLGVAGLFSQYAIFAIPGVLYYRYTSDQGVQKADLVTSIVTGAGTIFVATGVVIYSIWGVPSLLGAIEGTFVRVASYSTEGAAIYVRPVYWLKETALVILDVLFIILPAALAAGLIQTQPESDRLNRTVLLLLMMCLLPLLIRPFRGYWIYALPWLAILAAKGYREVLN